jgi:flagellar biosynthesis GTPase FlhF
MILQNEINLLKRKHNSILRSWEYTDEQVSNFTDFVLPSLARRNANMKQKRLHPSALDANYDKYSCGFQSCRGQLFSTKQKYVQHLNAKHRTQLPDGCRFLAPNDKSLYIDDLKCEGCTKVYSRIDKLEAHLKSSLFCTIQVAKSREAEQRRKAIPQQSPEEPSSDEDETEHEEQSSDEDETEHKEQSSDEDETEHEEQSSDEDETEHKEQSSDEDVSVRHQQKEELQEKLNEKHVGEYQQHEEQSEAENLDFEENILIAILNKYENHSKEMIQSKRKHITPSCSREQIAKKQTIDY